MSEDLTAQQRVAYSLFVLLAKHPTLESVVWSVGEQPGVLYGREICDAEYSGSMEALAEVAGGTVLHSATPSPDGGPGQGLAQIVTDYEGVAVHASSTYQLPDEQGLTSEGRYRLLAVRPLGSLACLPGGAR